MEDAKVLSLSDIKAANDTKVVAVNIPQWGGTVHVRSMSGRCRGRVEALIHNKQVADLKATVIIGCLCDPSGKLLLTEADRKWLDDKSADALELIFGAAAKASGIGSVEEAEKN